MWNIFFLKYLYLSGNIGKQNNHHYNRFEPIPVFTSNRFPPFSSLWEPWLCCGPPFPSLLQLIFVPLQPRPGGGGRVGGEDNHSHPDRTGGEQHGLWQKQTNSWQTLLRVSRQVQRSPTQGPRHVSTRQQISGNRNGKQKLMFVLTNV